MKILVVETRGWHVGYLGCYGNEWVATPTLDRIAAEGAVFDQHLVARPGTSARFEDNKVDAVAVASWSELVHDVPVRLRETSKSILWVEAPTLGPPWRLDADMAEVYCDEDEEPWLDPPEGNAGELPEDKILALQNTYAANVTAFDAQLERLLEKLEDDVILCLTASAGVSLGEHGYIGSTWPRLHAEAVHVPLILRWPNRQHAGIRVGSLTQSTDLLPTFLGGEGLWPLLRGEVDEIRPFAASVSDESYLLRTKQWAYLKSPGQPPELYAKPEDRFEVNEVSQQQPELCDAMEKRLTEWLALATF